MTMITIEQFGAGHATADVLAGLRNAHLQASAIVGALDLGDMRLWRQIDSVVAALATAAYDVAGFLTDQPAGRAAVSAPPVVRARELAAAQRRLFSVLDRQPSDAAELSDRAADHARQLVEVLRGVTLSMQRDPDRRSG